MKEVTGLEDGPGGDQSGSTFISSIKARIHGLEDTPLEPVLLVDFLSLIFEISPEEQREVVERAHQIIRTKKAQTPQVGATGNGSTYEDQFGVN